MLNTNIALAARPAQFEDPAKQYANVLAIQQAGNQNALAQYAMARAQREDELQRLIDDAYRTSVKPDGTVDRNALINTLASGGAGRAIPGIQKGFLEVDEKRGAIDKTALETRHKALEIIGGALTGLMQNPTRENIMAAGARLKALGIPGIDETLATLPANDLALPQWIHSQAAQTKQGLDALQAFAPKVNLQDTGGSIVPMNTNPLAGTIGPLVGGISTPKTATPGDILTDRRGWASQAEQRRHNLETEGTARDAADRADWQYDAERGVLVNKRTGATKAAVGADGQPLQPKLTEAQKKELTSIDSQLGVISGARDAVKTTPSAFTFKRGLATMTGPLTESAVGRTDSEDERNARSYVFNIVSAVINERAGAAQSKQELARLRSFLPAETDGSQQINDKLNAFETYLNDKRKAYEKPVTGAKQPSSDKKDARKVVRTGTYTDNRKVVEYSDGSVEYQ